MDLHATVDQPRAVGALDRVRLLDAVLAQLAGDRGQDVGRGDDALDDAVLVEHDRQAVGAAAEQLDQPHHGRALVHHHRRLGERGEVEAATRQQCVEQLADMDDADKVVEATAAHGIAAVPAASSTVRSFALLTATSSQTSSTRGRHDRRAPGDPRCASRPRSAHARAAAPRRPARPRPGGRGSPPR